MSGVLLTELHCPTCGRRYRLPLEVQRDEPEVVLAFGGPRWIKTSLPPFIECSAGHKWTLKTLFRREGEPDALLLGEYVGGGDLA